MTKFQIQLAWKKVANEIRKRSKLDEQLKDKNLSLLGELLLYAQVLLDKVAAGENGAFNERIYKKTMRFYCKQMKKYV